MNSVVQNLPEECAAPGPSPSLVETMPLGVEETEAPPASAGPASETDLLLARFRLRAHRRALWLQQIWMESGKPGGCEIITHGEMEGLLDDLDSPAAEEEWQRRDPRALAVDGQLTRIEAALAGLEDSRLRQLVRIFGLGDAELDLLQACAAVALDPALGRVCAYLHDHAQRTAMTGELAARLYGHGRCGAWPAESAVFRWDLVLTTPSTVGEPRAFACDVQLRDWLLGRAVLSEPLVGVARLHPARSPLADWPIEETLAWLRPALDGQPQARLRLQLSGPTGSGRRTFAATLARHLGLPLLVIDADQAEDANWRHVFLHAQRQAYLDGCALVWAGESLGRRPWPQVVPDFPLQFLILEPGREVPPAPHLVEYRVNLPSPSSPERARLWREHLPEASAWSRGDLETLAEQHRVEAGDIARAARLHPASARDAGRLAREAMRARLGPLAQLLETPFHWDDLVVPASVRQSLTAIAFEAQHRTRFWEQATPRRLFPQGRGLLALLSGPPGTGKTMAAQVLAAHLGQDLFRVNVAQLVSKWVGETAKHFEFLLTQAAGMDAILFFDEADAPFARRSAEVRDAQDKFANTDAAYLLQAIESFPGVALLATNLKANIDPAFLRRLRHLVEFPRPDATSQRTLWQRLVAELAGQAQATALEPTFASLSTGLDATGAQIKYAVLGALFEAQREGAPLGPGHLLVGIERELAKEGRSVGPRDRERILRHA